MKKKKEKTYILIYVDKNNNDILEVIISAPTKKDAERQRKLAFANANINNLKKIILR